VTARIAGVDILALSSEDFSLVVFSTRGFK